MRKWLILICLLSAGIVSAMVIHGRGIVSVSGGGGPETYGFINWVARLYSEFRLEMTNNVGASGTFDENASYTSYLGKQYVVTNAGADFTVGTNTFHSYYEFSGDASTEHMKGDFSFLSGATALTFTVWFYEDAFQNDWTGLVMGTDDAVTHRTFILQEIDGGATRQLQFYVYNGVGSASGAYTEELLPNRYWMQFAGVWSADDGRIQTYIDGVTNMSSIVTTNATSALIDGGRMTIGNDPLAINRYFDGRMSEITFYKNYAMSDAEVWTTYTNEVYNSTNHTPRVNASSIYGGFGRKALDEDHPEIWSNAIYIVDWDSQNWTANTYAMDNSPTHSLVWHNHVDPFTQINTSTNGYLYTDGSGPRAQLYDNHTTTLAGGSPDKPCTFSLWFKPTYMPNNVYRWLLTRRHTATTPEYDIRIYDDDTIAQVIFWGTNGGFISATSDYVTDPISIGDWHHLVATYDGSGNSNNIGMYLDGKHLVVTPGGGGSYTGMTDVSSACFLGNRYADYYFRGYLDAYSMYNRVLTSNEVLTLYNYGITRNNRP